MLHSLNIFSPILWEGSDTSTEQVGSTVLLLQNMQKTIRTFGERPPRPDRVLLSKKKALTSSSLPFPRDRSFLGTFVG